MWPSVPVSFLNIFLAGTLLHIARLMDHFVVPQGLFGQARMTSEHTRDESESARNIQTLTCISS